MLSCQYRNSHYYDKTVSRPAWFYKGNPWNNSFRPDNAHKYDDVIKWKHNFSRYWPFVRGIHRSPVNSPHKGQWRGTLMFSLICAWINGWVNNREAGHMRRHRTNYDVTLMISMWPPHSSKFPSCTCQAHHPEVTLLSDWLSFQIYLCKHNILGQTIRITITPFIQKIGNRMLWFRVKSIFQWSVAWQMVNFGDPWQITRYLSSQLAL